MAEMALVPSIYRQYSTSIRPDFEDVTPGITSRFEVFTDESFADVKVSLEPNVTSSGHAPLKFERNILVGFNSVRTGTRLASKRAASRRIARHHPTPLMDCEDRQAFS